ncbi:carbohydrate ABC transporter permease [Propionibacteriaceae bacterium G1746]
MTTTVTRPGPRHGGMAQQQRRAALLLLSPWLLGVVGITLLPILASLALSFTDYPLLSSPTFVGLDNFRTLLFEDERFRQSLVVTGIYTFVSVPLQLLFALVLAVFLNRGIRGLSVYRALFYLPSLLGGSVAIAILWRQVFGLDGMVNKVLAQVGVAGPDWLADPRYSLWTLIALNVWMFGSPMVIFLAALRQIPAELYEAAEVDGASKARRFFTITLPLLTPIVFFNMVLQFIHAFQAFTPAFIVSSGKGGPADSTLLYSLYLYQEGFGNLRMGYASAMAWILLLITALFTAVNFGLARLWVFNADD